MATKEVPVKIRTYYKCMKDRTSKQLEEAVSLKDELELESFKQRDELKSNLDVYKKSFDIDLLKFDEFVNNKYSTGTFYKTIKVLFINRKNDYKLVKELYDVYTYAELQKQIHDLDKDIEKYNKLLALNLKEYTEILRIYYTEVHKKIILEGCGYAFSGHIGWICANRVTYKHRGNRKTLDFAGTKKREAELKAQGKRIYNKEEAEWCAKNGIEYKAEDKRVYRNVEYNYEIPLLGCKLKDAFKLKLEMIDYRHQNLRGKTNDQLIEECNNDTNKICELSIDMKTKLTLCDKADKTLYTKFIRNENQESVAYTKANSKNR